VRAEVRSRQRCKIGDSVGAVTLAVIESVRDLVAVAVPVDVAQLKPGSLGDTITAVYARRIQQPILEPIHEPVAQPIADPAAARGGRDSAVPRW